MSVRDAYDAVAAEYAARLYDELAGKPLDRALLAAFAETVIAAGGRGPVVDVGCGPGHVTAHLSGLGLPAVGLDLSPRMVAFGRAALPRTPFVVGSVLALPAADASWAGAVALYSLIHLDRASLGDALTELGRVLAPGAPLLASVHERGPDGERDVRHISDWWGHHVDVDVRFLAADDLAAAIQHAGLDVRAVVRREPYPDVEVATPRAYVLAARPPNPPK